MRSYDDSPGNQAHGEPIETVFAPRRTIRRPGFRPNNGDDSLCPSLWC
jgi:hypothetical protein